MKISCNNLKKHIKDSHTIDFVKVWDKFTIRTAEVEEIIIKGDDLKDVVTAEIIECTKHETKENYSILKVSDGLKKYNVLCGAPNVRVGLKTFFVKPGGKVSGFTIDTKKIGGILSEGMVCSGVELGINEDASIIIELPEDTKLGLDIKDIYPVEDIIIEIDNKSLTNRPDLWGHYGIAREIAAITNKKLLPLNLESITNDKSDLDIKILNEDLCNRYAGIKIDNVENKPSPIELQIFLKNVGLRPISLLVDLTNYIMLELGQPMHAFDSSLVEKIIVDTNKETTKFTTLDEKERIIDNETLMIKNAHEDIAIAGIMGGVDSEIKPNTTSMVLESANFSAVSIRKSSIKLGLRTDASSRFEKSLDPNMCDIAIKRYVYLLKKYNPNIQIASNLTDAYPNKQEKNKVILSKEKLFKYLGKTITDLEIENILTSLDFEVEFEKDAINVLVPTNRSTKDVSIDVDIIEEVSRMYGYENLEEKPLILQNTFKIHETIYDQEYELKDFLTKKFNAHEVHSYLWYNSNFLNELKIEKKNIKVVNKNEDNTLRDDLALSLLPFVKNNFKNYSDFIIYEIGTVINNSKNNTRLALLLAGDIKNTEQMYNLAKKITTDIFKSLKNIEIEFKLTSNEENYVEDYILNIIYNDQVLGTIKIFDPKITNELGHKKTSVVVDIDFDLYANLEKENYVLKEITPYQTIHLDYTIGLENNRLYEELDEILKDFEDEYILNYKLVGMYKGDINNYTIRFEIGSFEKTLTQKEILLFQDKFISYIKEHKMNIYE